MNETGKMPGPIPWLSALDRAFADIAIGKGYITPADLVTLLGDGAVSLAGNPGHSRTLANLLYENGVMDCGEIDAVIDEMFSGTVASGSG